MYLHVSLNCISVESVLTFNSLPRLNSTHPSTPRNNEISIYVTLDSVIMTGFCYKPSRGLTECYAICNLTLFTPKLSSYCYRPSHVPTLCTTDYTSCDAPISIRAADKQRQVLRVPFVTTSEDPFGSHSRFSTTCDTG